MKKELKTLSIQEIYPYENNPRRNDHAVDDVLESFIQCGYIAPIIVDENNVILAGHTRYKAGLRLELQEMEVMQVTGMTEEQKKKYRLLDNKTNEKAGWDFALLANELENLDFEGYDFGWNINNDDIGNIDDMFVDAPEKESKNKTVTCPNCGETFEA